MKKISFFCCLLLLMLLCGCEKETSYTIIDLRENISYVVDADMVIVNESELQQAYQLYKDSNTLFYVSTNKDFQNLLNETDINIQVNYNRSDTNEYQLTGYFWRINNPYVTPHYCEENEVENFDGLFEQYESAVNQKNIMYINNQKYDEDATTSEYVLSNDNGFHYVIALLKRENSHAFTEISTYFISNNNTLSINNNLSISIDAKTNYKIYDYSTDSLQGHSSTDEVLKTNGGIGLKDLAMKFYPEKASKQSINSFLSFYTVNVEPDEKLWVEYNVKTELDHDSMPDFNFSICFDEVTLN